MNFSLLIARRYLFAKRSTNAINIITGISVLGMAIGTAALVLVLSVFNGFEDLLSGLFGHFNPEIKVTPARGKTFDADSIALADIRAIPGVYLVSETLEEIAFFEYAGSQDFGALKGVDEFFAPVTGINSDTVMVEGSYTLEEEERNCAILGAGLRNKLSVNVQNPIEPLTVYMPDQTAGALDKPFKTRLVYPKGTFAIQQSYDNEYVLTNINFVRELLETGPGTVSALEIKCRKGADLSAIKEKIGKRLGDGFVLKDHYEQNEAFFKVMKLEKWMGFAITSLMLLLMAFNTVGALWMIVLDKQKDISVLKSMGADNNMIRKIFLLEGMLLTFIGLVAGIVLAVIIYVIQKTWGIVTIPQGFVVDSYPISMRLSDFLPIILIVTAIGFLASVLPARRAAAVSTFFREE